MDPLKAYGIKSLIEKKSSILMSFFLVDESLVLLSVLKFSVATELVFISLILYLDVN